MIHMSQEHRTQDYRHQLRDGEGPPDPVQPADPGEQESHWKQYEKLPDNRDHQTEHAVPQCLEYGSGHDTVACKQKP